ncbi:hypothetical protein C8R44DRAFT_724643 [Mycena epipterygia]|nr:hypothetical protein C8R44DRAFT_724643 [Mycena epipterygia]
MSLALPTGHAPCSYRILLARNSDCMASLLLISQRPSRITSGSNHLDSEVIIKIHVDPEVRVGIVSGILGPLDRIALHYTYHLPHTYPGFPSHLSTQIRRFVAIQSSHRFEIEHPSCLNSVHSLVHRAYRNSDVVNGAYLLSINKNVEGYAGNPGSTPDVRITLLRYTFSSVLCACLKLCSAYTLPLELRLMHKGYGNSDVVYGAHPLFIDARAPSICGKPGVRMHWFSRTLFLSASKFSVQLALSSEYMEKLEVRGEFLSGLMLDFVVSILLWEVQQAPGICGCRPFFVDFSAHSRSDILLREAPFLACWGDFFQNFRGASTIPRWGYTCKIWWLELGWGVRIRIGPQGDQLCSVPTLDQTLSTFWPNMSAL